MKKNTHSPLFDLCATAASFAAYTLAILITGNASFAAALHSSI